VKQAFKEKKDRDRQTEAAGQVENSERHGGRHKKVNGWKTVGRSHAN